MMEDAVVQQILSLNKQFYTRHGAEFAATRRRIQPGVRRILAGLPDEGRWLDVGCGSGNLAAAWLAIGRTSDYCGVDFSSPLLTEASTLIHAQESSSQANTRPVIRFHQANLADDDWAAAFNETFYGIFSFAVLHHLPSFALRQRVLRQIRSLLSPGRIFYHSVWQFQYAPKLVARIQPWEIVGLSTAQVEPGDTLLDWRSPAIEPTSPRDDTPALRYVHRFDLAELHDLAETCGFSVQDSFESDGTGGRLGLYQQWQAI